MSVPIFLRVVRLMAATSLRVMDGTMRASTATAPSAPTMSPALEMPVSPVAWT